MRRRDRRSTWGLWGDFVPIADRDLRLEVNERTLADGTIRTAVDPAAGPRGGAKSCGEGRRGGRHHLHQCLCQRRERAPRAGGGARGVAERACRTASHEVLPEIREFERASTTALNAYLQPVVGALSRPSSKTRWRRTASPGSFHIVQSNGGVMSTATARETAGAHGPVGSGGRRHRRRGDREAPPASTTSSPAISAALRSTSRVIAGGKASLAAQTMVDFGLVIRTPMIEITTIGAGGGSIASVDRGGLLQVGPESAGSVPGPACYGAGQ